MNIFVAYGYNDRDRWIEDMVFPIIRSFESNCITGDGEYQGPITANVLKKITTSDAVIGFATQRKTPDALPGQTHQWIITELAAAVALQKPIVEVRELGVLPQGGLYMDLERIDYDPEHRDQCLVKIVKAVGSWHKTASVRIQLLPKGWAYDDLRPYLKQLKCSYVVKTLNYQAAPEPVQIDPIKGGLFINMPRVSSETTIKVIIEYGDRIWESDFESIDAFGIHLNRVTGLSLWERFRRQR